MGVQHLLQPSFTGGELAPNLYSRVDTAKYQTALRLAHNSIVHPSGGISNRPGTIYAATAGDSTHPVRLVPFVFSTNQAYMLEFGHEYIRIQTDTGTILNTGGASVYEITTTYQGADLFKLKFAQSGNVLYIAHPGYPTATLTRFADAPPNWVLAELPFINGPFMLANSDPGVTLTPSISSGAILTASANVFLPGHVGALVQLVQPIGAQSTGECAISGTGVAGTIPCGGTWRLQTTGNWSGTLNVEMSLNSGPWTLIQQFISIEVGGVGSFNVDTFGTADGPFQVRINMVDFVTGTCYANLSADAFTNYGIGVIGTVTSPTVVSLSTLYNAPYLIYLNSVAVVEWAIGSWCTENGWPSSVCFFDDRLCLGATPTEPDSVWMSGSSDYVNFGVSNPVIDSDSVEEGLPSRQLNAVQNIAVLMDIMALTSSTEWLIAPTNGGSITPTSVGSKMQSSYGSSYVTPVNVGTHLLFVQQMGTVVRNLFLSFQVNGYDSDDLSIFSNHLLTNYQIVEMAYQQEPDSIVWCVRNDGVLLSFTYHIKQAVQAWTWCDTEGTFESVACIPAASGGYNEVWFVVNRGGTRFIERLSQRDTSTDPADQFFVDCGLTYDDPITVTAWSTTLGVTTFTADGHGLTNGQEIDYSISVDFPKFAPPVVNPVDAYLNGNRYVVGNVTTNTFTLKDLQGNQVNTDPYSFSSFGVVRLVVSTISGLGYLANQWVSILANGSVQPQQQVSFVGSQWQITLSPPASVVQVGLPYLSEVWTLNPEVRMQDGTVQDRKMRIPRATIRFLNSRGGVLGTTPDNALPIPPQRTTEPAGGPIQLKTTKMLTSINTDFDIQDVGVYYAQKDPLPFTILSITPQVDVGG